MTSNASQLVLFTSLLSIAVGALVYIAIAINEICSTLTYDSDDDVIRIPNNEPCQIEWCEQPATIWELNHFDFDADGFCKRHGRERMAKKRVS